MRIASRREVLAEERGESAIAKSEADLVVRAEVRVEAAREQRVVVGGAAARPAGLQQRREDPVLDEQRGAADLELDRGLGREVPRLGLHQREPGQLREPPDRT